MDVSFEVHKIIILIIIYINYYIILFFYFGQGGVDEVLVRLQLIKQIIKDAHSMCI